jgi:hypothetical protein
MWTFEITDTLEAYGLVVSSGYEGVDCTYLLCVGLLTLFGKRNKAGLFNTKKGE